MKHKPLRLFLTLILFLIVVTTVNAKSSPETLSAVSPQQITRTTPVLAQDKNATGPALYIVTLTDAPLARYRGEVRGLAATSPVVTGDDRLDVESAESQAYLAYLESQQTDVIGRIAGQLRANPYIPHRYQVATNGFAIELTPEEAQAVANIPGVARVRREFVRYPDTDNGPRWIGAEGIWDGTSTAGLPGTKGEGMVVGIIDTGINMDHPSFADPGPSDGYDFPAPAGGYVGWCNPSHPNYDATLVCNDKLIGVYSYSGSNNNPEDDDGHGSHTGSTTAGNDIANAVGLFPTMNITRAVSGVAPHAHVISFDVCVSGAGCNGSAILAAIEDATALGIVDVINYSIGAPVDDDPWTAEDSLAFLSAMESGIFVATSAGNSGPGFSTVGSPANSPWLLATAAMTHDRSFPNKLVEISSAGGTLPDIAGSSLSAGYGPAPLVYAGTFGDALCLNPFPAGTFSGQIVICDRGTNGRVAKGGNVLAGGAGGMILANLQTAGGETTVGDPHRLPALHIGANAGDALKAWVATATNPMARISGSTLLEDANRGDMMADFSSRGPIDTSNVIKPDLGAPGVDILAAYENDADPATAEYNFVSGTSMASPHVAGAATLMRALYPSWSPMQIKSALMLTADNLNNRKENNTTPVDPFDVGAGRVDLSRAGGAMLVLEETAAGFLSADPNTGGDTENLNLASMQNGQCLGRCRWVRTVTNPTAAMMDWEALLTLPMSVTGTVTPTSFSLAPGASQTITVEVDVLNAPTEQWLFGALELSPVYVPARGGEVSETHRLPIALMSVTGRGPDHLDIYTKRDQGTMVTPPFETIEVVDLTTEVFGLTKASMTTITLAVDPTNTDAYDDLSQVWYTTFDVVSDTVRIVAETIASQAPDVDIFWGMDTNGNGEPDASEELGMSATPSNLEYLNQNMPEPGKYWLLVQNWDGGSADSIVISIGIVPMSNAGNMTVSGPTTVPAGTPYSLDVSYNLASMAGDLYYGAFTVDSGDSNVNPNMSYDIAFVSVDYHRTDIDVMKESSTTTAAVGETFTYTITVSPNEEARAYTYHITDTLPMGLQLVSTTATAGTVTTDDNKVIWHLVQEAPLSTYNVYHSATTASCVMPFSGSDGEADAYTDLAAFDLTPEADMSGDSDAWTVSAENGYSWNFYGEEKTSFTFTDDGFGYFSGSSGTTPWENAPIPTAAAPNDLVAYFWRDMEIFAGASEGVTIAKLTSGDVPQGQLIEFDNISDWAESGRGAMYDMEVLLRYGNTPTYEIIMAYDNLEGDVMAGTIGLENRAGDDGVQVGYNDLAITDGTAICYDLVLVPPAPAYLTIEVMATPGFQCSAEPNMAEHSVDMPGSVTEMVMADVDPVVCVGTDRELIGAVLPPNASTDVTLPITNTGSITAGFEVMLQDEVTWVTVSPQSGEIAPEQRGLVDVNFAFDSAGLGAGVYSTIADVYIISKGYRYLHDQLPVTLVVQVPTDVVVSTSQAQSASNPLGLLIVSGLVVLCVSGVVLYRKRHA